METNDSESSNASVKGRADFSQPHDNTVGVKPVRDVSLPSNLFETQWSIMKQPLLDILHQRPLTCTKTSIYRTCETLCLVGYEQQLYNEVEKITDEYIQEIVKFLESSEAYDINQGDLDMGTEEEQWLKRVNYVWNNFNNSLDLLQKVLSWLDRGYLLNSDAVSLRSVVCRQFRQHVLSRPFILTKSLTAVLWALNLHRNTEDHSECNSPSIARSVASISELLDDLDLYDGEFEDSVLASSRSFYEQESLDLVINSISSNTFLTSSYVQHVKNRLHQEHQKISPMLLPNSITSLQSVILEELLQRHSTAILLGFLATTPIHDLGLPKLSREKGFYRLLVLNDFDSLSTLYDLMNQINRLKDLKKFWSESIKAEGFYFLQKRLGVVDLTSTSPTPKSSLSAALNAASSHQALGLLGAARSDQRLLISDFLTFEVDLKKCLINVFHNDEEFEMAMKVRETKKDSFETFMNATADISNQTSCLLAKYCDDLLRINKSVTMTDAELITQLERIMSIFKFLHAKDFFKAFYRKDLSKRLLLNRSRSIDLERSMIQKLREECGPGFTAKMDVMFKELELSKKTFRKFREDPSCASAELSAGMSFECHVVAAGIWPFSTGQTLTKNENEREILKGPMLPSQMTLLQNAYSDFYKQIQKGRNLHWIASMASCVVRAAFHDAVTQTQALCLLLFNEANELTVEDISKAICIDVHELQRHIVALFINPSRRVLLKLPEQSKETRSDDIYKVNESFTSKLRRVFIAQIMLKETKEEIEETEQRVEVDRTHHIDALIVRLMKSKKEMKHNELMGEVMNGLLFQSSSNTIKSRIELLIDREFLERDSDDPQKYKYVA